MAPRCYDGRMRVGFFLRHAFHRPILEPIATQVSLRHDVCVSGSKWRLVDFNPHVLVAAEALRSFRFHYYLPFTLFVHTRHGLASKGVAVQSASFSHYTCVTSPHMRDWYLDQGVKPRRGFWITGYPQMDGLFAPEAPELPFSVPTGRRVVLYAPSFQTHFTSIHMLGPDPIAALGGGRPDVFVVVKPHPLIAKHEPGWLARIQKAAAGRNDAYVAGDADRDVMPFLRAADALVTDVSSTMLEYLALDRPIVLITNPDHRRESFYDPKGFEWAWRDAGVEVDSGAAVAGAVAGALADPDLLRERRRHYRRCLFGDLADGRSVGRIVGRINRLRAEVAGDHRLATGARWSRLMRMVQRLGSTAPRDGEPLAGRATA
jgi:hypothetical protein